MESVLRMKKSLRAPIRGLTSCVTGAGERRLCAKRRNRRGRGGRLGKTPAARAAHERDEAALRSYQEDLEKERKLREAMNAQKNAERASMRAHFRRKYRLSESPKDINHLRSVGRKVSLPRELSKIIHPEKKRKDDGFNLLSAFQGLGLGAAALTGRKHTKSSTPTPAGAQSCKVM